MVQYPAYNSSHYASASTLIMTGLPIAFSMDVNNATTKPIKYIYIHIYIKGTHRPLYMEYISPCIPCYITFWNTCLICIVVQSKFIDEMCKDGCTHCILCIYALHIQTKIIIYPVAIVRCMLFNI